MIVVFGVKRLKTGAEDRYNAEKLPSFFENFHHSNELFLSQNVLDFCPGVGIRVYRQSV